MKKFDMIAHRPWLVLFFSLACTAVGSLIVGKLLLLCGYLSETHWTIIMPSIIVQTVTMLHDKYLFYYKISSWYRFFSRVIIFTISVALNCMGLLILKP